MEKGLSASDRLRIERQFSLRSPGRLLPSGGQQASEDELPHRARDLVCGRLIETSVEAGPRVFVHRERLFFFCGTDCRDLFASMPERFTGSKADGAPGRRRRRQVR